MALRSQLLRLALPLVKTHGFTREALAQAALALPEHKEPLSDIAISALFGPGDEARRTLINAWLGEGLECMAQGTKQEGAAVGEQEKLGRMPEFGGKQPGNTKLSLVLHARLAYNEPVLSHIPEAFALLASPTSGLPPLDPTPALKHASQIADEACYVVGDQSLFLAWYARRASIAAIYAAAELHQLASPGTAHSFLDSLLASSTSLRRSLDEVGLYSNYVVRSWAGIIKSSGIF
ncbi:hypothetical protein AX17_006607 [Amanita inopinata Kibby_2008]|nr:hypothetical protein AX17_006607 [Amanita inopinata Kibby_2008]